MWKHFLGGLCIFSVVTTLSGNTFFPMDCCDLLEVVFSVSCKPTSFELEDYVTISNKSTIHCSTNTDWNQEKFSPFEVVFKVKNTRERANCYRELDWAIENGYESKAKLNILLEVCKLHVRSFTMNSIEFSTDQSNFNIVPSHMTNITELSWKMHYKCHRANDFIAQFKYLKVLTIEAFSSVNLNECEDFSFDGAPQLTKLHININKPSYMYTSNLNSYAFNATLLRGLKNLKHFKLNCGTNMFEVDLPREMFQGLTSLSELTLEHCRFNKLSTAHFQDLTNLKILNVSYTRFSNLNWIRYDIFVHKKYKLYIVIVFLIIISFQIKNSCKTCKVF